MATHHQNPAGATSADPVEDIKQQALAYVRKVWPPERQACPICGSKAWGISETAVIPRRIDADPSSGVDLSRVYSVVPINCSVCGYTIFINEKWIREGGTPPAVRAQMEAAGVEVGRAD